VLARRGHFRIEPWLWSRILRQLAAGGAMVAALWGVRTAMADFFAGSTIERMAAVGAIVATGGIVYFGVAWAIGAVDREAILTLTRRRRGATAGGAA
jgi:putative peptidoglycan lipid II flippase